MGQVSKPRPLSHSLTSLQHTAVKVEQRTAKPLGCRFLFMAAYVWLVVVAMVAWPMVTYFCYAQNNLTYSSGAVGSISK